MQKNPVKKYKMKDLIPVVMEWDTGRIIYVPKDQFEWHRDGTLTKVKITWHPIEEKSTQRRKSYAKKPSEKGLTKKKEEK